MEHKLLLLTKSGRRSNHFGFQILLTILIFYSCGIPRGMAQPANDLCENAEMIPNPAILIQLSSRTTTGSTTTGAPPDCGPGVDNSSAGGAWFKIMLTGGVGYQISACSNSSFDPEISLFTGTCGALTCVGGNDNSLTCGGDTGAKILIVPPSTQLYYLYMTGDGTSTGAADIIIVRRPGLAPQNDLCDNARHIPIPMGGTGVINGYNSIGSPTDPPANCGVNIDNSDVGGLWYEFTGTGGMFYEITTCGNSTTFDTELSLYMGACGAFTCIDGNDDSGCFSPGGGASSLFVSPSATTQYYLYLNGNDGASGDFRISISDLGTMPENDLCGDAQEVIIPSGGTGFTVGTTSLATTNGAPVNCIADINNSDIGGTWYTFTGTGGLFYEITTCDPSTSLDTEISVYTGVCGELICVDGNDDDPSCIGAGTASTVGVTPFVNTQYYVYVKGNGGTSGNFGLNISDLGVCAGPTAFCQNATVQLDASGSATINPANVNNGSMIPCGLQSMTVSPDVFDCTNLGDNTVTLLVTDVNGNSATCEAVVTVEGLPCGFASDDDGIGCTDGSSANYDLDTDVFTITSEGCYDPAFYSSSDSHGFISSDLCGDGEIIAEITDVNGNGWAGITMRENDQPGAKMLQLMIDGAGLTMRELRQSTGGIAFAHMFGTAGRNWLRLTRSGNTFGAYHSEDGVNWQPVLITSIPMTNCIEIGLVTANKAASGSITATFENVSITGAAPAPLIGYNPVDIESQINFGRSFGLHPNPTNGEAFVNLQEYLGEKAVIRIFSPTGQLLERIRIDEVQVATQRLDLSTFQDGLYLINLSIEGYPDETKKLMLNRN